MRPLAVEIGDGGFVPLRPGRQAQPRDAVDSYQRARLVAALAGVLQECGAMGLTTRSVVQRAGMSAKTFYELFDSKEDLVEFACEESGRALFAPVEAAARAERPWLERLDAAIGAFLAVVVENRALAEISLIHSAALGGPEADRWDQRGTSALAEAIGGGREVGREMRPPAYPEPPEHVEEFIAGAVIAITVRRLKAGQLEALGKSRRNLVSLAATPFVGPEAVVGWAERRYGF